MKRTSLSSNFTYWPPPQPPRASFDDDRDLDAISNNNNKVMFDIDNWPMIDGVDQMEQEEYFEENIEHEKSWFAFQVENPPTSLRILVRLFR